MPTHAGARPGAAWVTASAALLTAVLLYATVVGMEVGTAQRAHIPSVLVAMPAVVGLAFGPPMIMGTAVVAAGTRWAFIPLESERGIGPAIGTTVAVFAVALVACFVAQRRDRQATRLWEVTSIAETAQRAVLRPPPAVVGMFRTAASYRAAAQFARIGGDLYAVADTAYGVRALIGDVRGKGLDAVSTAAVVLGSFHEAAYDRPTLDGLADRLEVSLQRHLADSEAFVTALLVEVAPDGTMRVLSCGHPTPVILRGLGVLPVVVPAGLPLGLRGLALALDPGTAGTPEPAASDVAEVALRPCDTLLMYTDGLAEARDEDGTFYPLARRLTTYLRGIRQPCDPAALLAWVQTDAGEFAGGFAHDDAALLALTWTQEEAATGPGAVPAAR